MNKPKFFAVLGSVILFFSIISCKPGFSIRTTTLWVNKEKLPPEPLKSIFIIAFTDNLDVRANLEKDLANAAQKRGLKTYKSLDVVGPVEIKAMAPVRDVFIKKLQDLGCEAVLTTALVHATSETKYTPASDMTYTPYAYGAYAGYGGFAPYGAYGGFGGYYGYAVTTMSTPGYYTTTSKYFVEAKVFDLKTDETLMSMQTKVENPETIEKASKAYTDLFVEEIKEIRKK
ncbi:MAG TPA: hypothetical protein VGQ53_17645 [Chitinophagaceae bacterium]|jgi:hypothetical protein|nr:hypothetical protein [Chitinophagaceae bacterium]